MKKFKIMAETNSYIAQRDSMFNGSTSVCLASGLTQKDANKQLLDLYNQKYSDDAANWGLAVIHTKDSAFGATPTFSDGTRSFEFDSRTFCTVIEEGSADIKTLDDLADYINGYDEWPSDVEDICEAHGWELCDSDWDIAIDHGRGEILTFSAGPAENVVVNPYDE